MRVRVTGVVQGVGFRPFVHNLAGSLGLSGWVRNTSSGVDIEVGGPGPAMERFLASLQGEAPPLAQIDDLVWEPCLPPAEPGFRILPSLAAEGGVQWVAADRRTREPANRGTRAGVY